MELLTDILIAKRKKGNDRYDQKVYLVMGHWMLIVNLLLAEKVESGSYWQVLLE